MKWDQRFLRLSEHVAQWSKDSTKVGAVIVRPDRTVASVGYNGFPRGVKDTDRRLRDREEKYPLTVHAEVNAVLSAHEPVRGHTVYVSGLPPCCSCAGVLIQSGIRKVVARTPGSVEAWRRWEESIERAEAMFSEAGVDLLWLD